MNKNFDDWLEVLPHGVKGIPIEITPAMKTHAANLAAEMGEVKSDKILVLVSKENKTPKERLIEGDYIGRLFELALRKLLYENNRKYEAPEIKGKTDKGQDIKIAAGWIDAKATGKSPYTKTEFSLMVKEKCAAVENPEIKFFAAGFVFGDKVLFVGMETRENLITPTRLKKSSAGKDHKNYEILFSKLSIKPTEILSEPYTLPKIETPPEKEESAPECYLEGCEKKAIDGAFCSPEHKEKYWKRQGGAPLDKATKKGIRTNFQFTSTKPVDSTRKIFQWVRPGKPTIGIDLRGKTPADLLKIKNEILAREQVEDAEHIFNVKSQTMTFGEKKALKAAGEDALVYRVNGGDFDHPEVLLKSQN